MSSLNSSLIKILMLLMLLMLLMVGSSSTNDVDSNNDSYDNIVTTSNNNDINHNIKHNINHNINNNIDHEHRALKEKQHLEEDNTNKDKKIEDKTTGDRKEKADGHDMEFVQMEVAHHNYSRNIHILGPASPNQRISLIFVLQQDYLALESKFNAVSNPNNALEYGKYLTREELMILARKKDVSSEFVVNELIRISNEFKKIKQDDEDNDWSQLNVDKVSLNGDFIYVTSSVKLFEMLLDTNFYTMESLNWSDDVASMTEESHDTRIAIRAFEYSLPKSLAKHVGTVIGTVQHPFAVRRANWKSIHQDNIKPLNDINTHRTQVLQSELLHRQRQEIQSEGRPKPELAPITGYIYPQLLMSHYGITPEASIPDLRSQIVYSSDDESFSLFDLLLFQETYKLPITTPLAKNGHELTGPCTKGICFESNLDLQYISSIAPYTPTIMWYEADTSAASFTLFLAEVNELSNPPGVISISYGMLESYLTYNDKLFFDIEAMKLANRGVTILVASGDGGVAGYPSSPLCGYNPMFPSSSPFVTSVGGTSGVQLGLREMACQGDAGDPVTSGGGFSDLYKTPWWQDNAVRHYFDQVNEATWMQPYVDEDARSSILSQQKYNRWGRGYPDISASAVDFAVVSNGTFYALSGTSCAVPVVAGMISLINSQRQAAGLPTVGFINVALYNSNESAANDITFGDNRCYQLNHCCKQGFYSAMGWDPVSGLGAIDFPRLYHILVRSVLASGSNDRHVSNATSVSHNLPVSVLSVLFGCTMAVVIMMFVCTTDVCLFGKFQSPQRSNRYLPIESDEEAVGSSPPNEFKPQPRLGPNDTFQSVDIDAEGGIECK